MGQCASDHKEQKSDEIKKDHKNKSVKPVKNIPKIQRQEYESGKEVVLVPPKMAVPKKPPDQGIGIFAQDFFACKISDVLIDFRVLACYETAPKFFCTSIMKPLI